MIFLYIGLPKTGSSFLQTQVFPKWHAMRYLRNAALETLVGMRSDAKYLVANEVLSGRLWHMLEDPNVSRLDYQRRCVGNLGSMFPDGRVIVCFRRQESYITSVYKQYLHAGGTANLEEFFNFDADEGIYRRADFFFRPVLDRIVEVFEHSPFVFLHNELRSNLFGLLDELACYIGEPAPVREEIDTGSVNKGVGLIQAKVLRKLNRVSSSPFNPGGFLPSYSHGLSLLRLDAATICRRWLAFVSHRPLVLAEPLRERISAFYSEDWSYVTQYREQRDWDV